MLLSEWNECPARFTCERWIFLCLYDQDRRRSEQNVAYAHHFLVQVQVLFLIEA